MKPRLFLKESLLKLFFGDHMLSKQQLFDRLAEAVIKGSAEDSRRIAEEALGMGVEAYEAITEGLVKGMDVVGRKFSEGEYYVPEVLISARAMYSAMEVLKPYVKHEAVEEAGRVVIGTVYGDLHDIGKSLVRMMLEGAGFEVYDLGVDVSKEAFIEKAREVKADIIAMSALITTTMTYMREVIEALKQAGLRDKVKVLVGGAPLTEDYAKEIGADGYASDAVEAVKKAKELLAELRKTFKRGAS